MDESGIGWIGLGAMGWPMAGHLHRSGQLAGVWNRSQRKAAAFAEQHPGTRAAATPAQLAEHCNLIMLCVSADHDLNEVVETLMPVLRAGQILVDHSTVSPATSAGIRKADSPRAPGASPVRAKIT